VCLVLVALTSASGCDAGRLQFKNDHRLSFQTPHARETVTAPVTVRWSMTGFDAVGLDGSRTSRRGAFGVFVDRAPMPVGKDLKSLVTDDAGCRHDARCPDAQYLSDRGVFVTTQPEVTLEVLRQQADGGTHQQHYVNVILLDGTGRRIGESAWYLPFVTKRRSAS
jgi:hypothetical protein